MNQLKALIAEQEKDVARVRQREELLAKVCLWALLIISSSLMKNDALMLLLTGCFHEKETTMAKV